MKRTAISQLLSTLVLLALLTVVPYAGAQSPQAEKESFAKVVAEEYVKLLERRMSEGATRRNSAKGDTLRALDRQTIEDIRKSVLPEIESGRANVVVQSSGVIAVETDDRRIALLAPNQKWDDEFRAIVKWRSKGNTFAVGLISEAERRSGKAFPAYEGATRRGRERSPRRKPVPADQGAPPPTTFVLSAAEALLAGDRRKISGFVTWSSTPQGHEFWAREAASLNSGGTLSPEAEAAVRSWVRAAKQR